MNLILALLLAAPASALNGKLTHAVGKVTVNMKAAKKGLALKGGDSVATGAKSLAVITLDGGGQLKLKEFSSVTLAGATDEVALNSGGVFAKIAKRAGLASTFKLRTPSAVAAVRGTEFFTAFGRKTDVWLCVNEGAVEVVSSGKKVLVPAGKGILVAAGKAPGEPKPFEWTKGLNWNMDPARGEVNDTSSLDTAYSDPLGEDYR